MGRRRNPKGSQSRHALPPLHDKEVKILSITKEHMWNDTYSIYLMVDGLPYHIFRKCPDELSAFAWVVKLQRKGATK